MTKEYYAILQKQISSIEVMNIHRPPHLEYLRGIHENGELIIAGRYKNGSGGLIVVYTLNYDRALEIAKNDPYIINNVREFDILEYGVFDPQSIP